MDVLPGMYPPLPEDVLAGGSALTGAEGAAIAFDVLAVENDGAGAADGAISDGTISGEAAVGVVAGGSVIAATAGESVGNVNPPAPGDDVGLAGGGVV